MGKFVGRAGSPALRKPAPARGRVVSRSPSGRTTAPAHDLMPFARGGPTVPKDKGWCRKCHGWRYYRKIVKVQLENGKRGYQGNCTVCGTKHVFVPKVGRSR